MNTGERPGWFTRLALRAVPRHLRESVLGDLLEEGAGAAAAWGLALHFQAEPYRSPQGRQPALLLLVAAGGLLWIVPMAAQALLAQAGVFADPFSRTVVSLWRAPALGAALACGLLIGRVSLLPPHADAVRLHLALLLAPAAAWAALDALQAGLAALLLPAATGLAWLNRQATDTQAEADAAADDGEGDAHGAG